MIRKMEFVQTLGIWLDEVNLDQMSSGFVSLTIKQVCGIVILCILPLYQTGFQNSSSDLVSDRGHTVSISEVSQTAKANAQHFRSALSHGPSERHDNLDHDPEVQIVQSCSDPRHQK